MRPSQVIVLRPQSFERFRGKPVRLFETVELFDSQPLGVLYGCQLTLGMLSPLVRLGEILLQLSNFALPLVAPAHPLPRHVRDPVVLINQLIVLRDYIAKSPLLIGQFGAVAHAAEQILGRSPIRSGIDGTRDPAE